MKRLAAARRLSQRTASVIRQNLVFAIGAMLVLVTGAAFFELPLPLAVLGHEGGTVLVVLNGLRLLNDPIRNTRPPMTATHTNRAPAEPPEQGPTPRAAATA
jgi:cation transport ATPase